MDKLWWEFLLAFLAGLGANQVFVMLSNTLPITFSRYEITFGDVFSIPASQLEGETWGIRVLFQPPRSWFTRLLRPEPLIEYVESTVDYGGGRIVSLQWEQGDIRALQLRVDGVRSTPLHLLEVQRNAIHYPLVPVTMAKPLFARDGEYPLVLTITRSYDQKISQIKLKLVFIAGKVSLSKEGSQT